VSFLRSLLGAKPPRFVEIEPLGTRFEVLPGKTILEAALASGVAFPHDCTVGTCGTCKCRLLQGRVDSLSEFAYTLSQQELAANFILPCQSMARDPLVRIEVTIPAALAKIQAATQSKRFEARIVAQTPLTHDIVHVQVELDRPIRYIAGQYANFAAPEHIAAFDGISSGGGKRSGPRARSYSFAEPPAPSGSTHVGFFVRRVPNGAFTEALFAGLLTGVPLQFDGPHGMFHLREGTGPIVCVAGGSGLAPILSMLQDAVRRSITRPCVLLFGAQAARDLYALEQIDTLSSCWAGPFQFLPVLSHEPADSAWAGARGLVTDFVGDAMPTVDWARVQGYLCGPPAMIDVGIASLTERGVLLGSIFYDKFTDARYAARMA
jgi:p-cymene methyl-monooxygenase electron transfer component